MSPSGKRSLTISDGKGHLDSCLRGGRAYQAGKLARQAALAAPATASVLPAHNPFRPGTDRFRAWLRGWRDGGKPPKTRKAPPPPPIRLPKP